jgi:hypothetical protein
MPRKDVNLKLDVKKTGAISVSVFPCRRHLSIDDADSVRFNVMGDATWAEITFTNSQWPFSGTNRMLQGDSTIDSPALSSRVNAEDVRHYTITLYYDDFEGIERSVTIDPDMVIDT